MQNVIKNSKFNSKCKIMIIDVGTGSGCIIVSLVKELLDHNLVRQANQVIFFATDISSYALTVAKINAKKHRVDKYIKLYQGNLLEPVVPDLVSLSNQVTTIIIIIANLPYITPNIYQTLAPEIKKYEPKLALLTPDKNPNYYYKKLDKQIDQLQKITKAKIWRFYEKSNF
jgi:release factor glutamine methyltransferase